ncbi:putative Lipopolysaccharide biosynthesis protein [Nitrospira sp. KM1]|uniref:GumC family protein n=1 Tax=Nitrospira sp. KM1 TaxID=1936990 RepID=UPI0013A79150|nr:Wzz/FepE/Etk N-terminal domain-containing protein [Nitrospira sp. KM1]BCA53544.1 putative Lipopolysaccharide biosynthesis protein [Nitrospira sp. KM1]
MTTPHKAHTASAQSIQDYVSIFHRRRKLILSCGGALLLLSMLAALLWPPTYKSMATILIEEQEIPSDLVRSSITSYADQRIETIKQQVMSRTTLWKVVEQFDLYAELRKTSPIEEVVKRFIRDIDVEVISADVVDKRTQHPTKATIAFTVAYESRSPEVAQKVANELTSLFLGENLKSRERQAQEATAFLQQEAESLAKHIGEVDAKIAGFKHQAKGALPELTPLNQQLMNQADRELMDVEQQIRSLEERKNYLEGELATIKPHTPIISASGERILDSAERLRALRAEYAGTAANLSPDHPDIMRMKQEIGALEKETGHVPEADEATKALVDARATLAEFSERLGKDHPDVVSTMRRIEALEQEVRNIKAKPSKKNLAPRPENPAYINLQAQLNSANSTLDALRKTRGEVKRRLNDYASRLERTPELEPDYLTLTRDRDTSGQKYQEIRSRLLEAKVSEGLEVQRKGERFSLIDPPSLPEKPEKPNRPAIAVLGFILALAGGFGAGAAAENLDHSVKSPEQLAHVTQLFPLAVIPFMPNESDLSRAINRRRLIRGAGVAAVVVVLVLVHVFWSPLDVIWYSTVRRFGME